MFSAIRNPQWTGLCRKLADCFRVLRLKKSAPDAIASVAAKEETPKHPVNWMIPAAHTPSGFQQIIGAGRNAARLRGTAVRIPLYTAVGRSSGQAAAQSDRGPSDTSGKTGAGGSDTGPDEQRPALACDLQMLLGSAAVFRYPCLQVGTIGLNVKISHHFLVPVGIQT